MDKSLIWCIIVLLMPIVIMTVHTLYKRLMVYLSQPFNYTGDYWKNQSKKTPVVTKPVIKEKIVRRKHPPCATFFSKVDGKERQVDGPYEEKWLTSVEKWNWKVRRNR